MAGRAPVGGWRWRRALVVVAIGVGGLTACADNSGGSAGTTSASAVSTPPPASAPAGGSIPGSTPVAPVESAPGSSPSRPPSSAVGSSAATTTTVVPTAPEACSVLTPDEISYAAGQGTRFGEGRPDTPQATPYGDHTACTWTSTDGPDATVRVSVWDEPTAFDDARTQVGSTGDVTGIGDRAFASTLASIYAVADGHTIFVQFQDLDRDDAANLAVTTVVAPLAVARM